MTSALITPAEIRQALSVLDRHADIDHQPAADDRCPRCLDVCPVWLGAVRALRSAGWQVATVPPHEPARPSWRCARCADEWPCSQARGMLGDRYGLDARADLVALMRYRRAQAAAELRVPPDDLEGRFVEWAARWA